MDLINIGLILDCYVDFVLAHLVSWSGIEPSTILDRYWFIYYAGLIGSSIILARYWNDWFI